MPSTYTKKNGEVVTYNIKQYNATSYEKNKEKLSSKMKHCDFCNIDFKATCTTNHNRSKRHIMIVNAINKTKCQPPEVASLRDASNDASLAADLCELEIR